MADISLDPAAVLGARGPLARARPGFRERPRQVALAERIAGVLRRGGVLLAEAGTGTGKTLAYLAPALLGARRVVISTATRPLQDQIARQDAPRLAADLGVPLDMAVLKGRHNYLCLHRLAQIEPPADLEERAHLAQIEDWAATSPDGDRAAVAGVPEDATIWSKLTVSGDACLQSRCPHHAECYVTRGRARASEAALVVVNHHLYFADLALRAQGAGALLPDHDAVIFDEAHAIPEIAGLFFGVRVDSGQVGSVLRDVAKACPALDLAPITAAADRFFRAVRPADGRTRWDPHDRPGATDAAYLGLDDALDVVRIALDDADDTPVIARLRGRLGGVRRRLNHFFEPPDQASSVWFCEPHGVKGAALSMQPVDASDRLQAGLFERMRTVVALSATLSLGDDFEYARARLGAPADCERVRFDSPFDFDTQARLYLPTHLPPPTADDWLPAFVDEVEQLCRLTEGRALVLFTSLRDMRAAHAAFRGRLPHPLAVQGEAPRDVLLRRLRTVPHTTLFATASFWTGVDVPGDALSLVVIARLPFGAPTDPVLQARMAAARAAGLDPFGAVQLPAAAITLKQGVGRLIRTHTDRGIVALLDGRITSRGYGATLLDALPPIPRLRQPADLVAWWRRSG